MVWPFVLTGGGITPPASVPANSLISPTCLPTCFKVVPPMQSLTCCFQQKFDRTNNTLGSPVAGGSPVTLSSFTAFLSSVLFFDFWSTTLNSVVLDRRDSYQQDLHFPRTSHAIIDFNFVTPNTWAVTRVYVYNDACYPNVIQTLADNLPNFTCWVHVVSGAFFISTGSTHIYWLDQPCSVNERRVFILYAA